ncbi:MAG: helix-turn-helix transcriptional regulator [Bacteroidota bacterium]
MKPKKLKIYTLEEVEDQLIGKRGTPARDKYEFDLSMDLLGDAIRDVRLQRKLTQEQLGKLVGVQKAQISKLEKKANNVTVETILKIFMAMKATVNFRIELLDKKIKLV